MTCEVILSDILWPVEADDGQISKVVHNLVLNAREAMPAGGVIKIRAENVTST
ncbi:MAG: histidine phosphotransferase family protein [Acidobacteriota bacterium]